MQDKDVIAGMLDGRRAAVLDGGLATHLEDALGCDLSASPLWSASLLDDKVIPKISGKGKATHESGPEILVRAHRNYLEAGADVIGTATYQASVPGFVRAGYTEQRGVQLMRYAVHLARRAHAEYCAARSTAKGKESSGSPSATPLVALSLGPYGAMLGNGAEYTGYYRASPSDPQPTTADLAAWHLARLRVFAQDEPIWRSIDVIAFETFPRRDEARAVRIALRTLAAELADQYGPDTTGKAAPWWRKAAYVSFVFPDGERLPWPMPSPTESKNSDADLREVEDYALVADTLGELRDEENQPPQGQSQPWPLVGLVINFSKQQYIKPLVDRLTDALTTLRREIGLEKDAKGPYLFVYPDGGLVWDGIARVWRSPTACSPSPPSQSADACTNPREGGSTHEDARAWAAQLLDVLPKGTGSNGGVAAEERAWKGVLLGGCCKSGTAEVSALKDALGAKF